jgi:hypothetical protein
MEKYINNVREALIELDQISMFDSGNSVDLIEACKDLLLHANYRVVKINEITGVDNLIKLVEAFYLLYQNYYPDNEKPYRNDKKHDFAAAKRFLEWRIEQGELSEKAAYDECVMIMKAVMVYSNTLGIKNISFGFFASSKTKWVINKALDLVKESEQPTDYDDMMADIFAERYHRTHKVTGILEESDGGI